MSRSASRSASSSSSRSSSPLSSCSSASTASASHTIHLSRWDEGQEKLLRAYLLSHNDHQIIFELPSAPGAGPGTLSETEWSGLQTVNTIFAEHAYDLGHYLDITGPSRYLNAIAPNPDLGAATFVLQRESVSSVAAFVERQPRLCQLEISFEQGLGVKGGMYEGFRNALIDHKNLFALVVDIRRPNGIFMEREMVEALVNECVNIFAQKIGGCLTFIVPPSFISLRMISGLMKTALQKNTLAELELNNVGELPTLKVVKMPSHDVLDELHLDVDSLPPIPGLARCLVGIFREEDEKACESIPSWCSGLYVPRTLQAVHEALDMDQLRVRSLHINDGLFSTGVSVRDPTHAVALNNTYLEEVHDSRQGFWFPRPNWHNSSMNITAHYNRVTRPALDLALWKEKIALCNADLACQPPSSLFPEGGELYKSSKEHFESGNSI